MNDTHFAFDAFRVDVAGREIRHGETRVDLEPKAFDVLVLLLRDAGRVVDKRRLLGEVWADVHVTDSSLARAVTQVRRALGDDPKAPRFIETVPTRGYRFVAEVRLVELGNGPVRAPVDPMATRPVVSRTSRWLLALATSLAIATVVGLVAGSRLWRRGPPELTAVGAALVQAATQGAVQLTTSRGLDLDPAFSPDATLIAYVTDRTGALEIEVQSRVATAQPRSLTANGGDNVQPAWSPDGLWLAYHSRRDGGIWLVPSTGGSARQIVTDGSAPAWSPDGRSIAFQTAGQPDLLGGPGGARSTIAIVDVDSGRVRPVTSPGQPAGSHGRPVWLPSGRRIAFSVVRVPVAEVWQVDLVGQAAKIAPCDSGCRPFVVRQGEESVLAFVDTWPRPVLYTVRLVDDEVPPGATPASTALPATIDLKSLAVSPDLSYLAYTATTRTSELWQVTLGAGGPADAAAEAPLLDERRHRHSSPAISPDGRLLAFTAMRAGGQAEAWVLDLVRGTSRHLGDGFGSIKGWTPDGRSLLLTGHDGPTVRRLDLTTGRSETFLAFAGWQRARDAAQRLFTLRVAPDQRRYVYTAEDDEGLALWLGDVRQVGQEARVAGDATHGASFGVWSSAGDRLAYQRAQGWRTALVVQPATRGGEPRTLLADVDQAWVNGWSPDDAWVVAASLRRGRWQLEAVEVATGKVVPLTDAAAPAEYVRWPTWSPRGDRVVFERGHLAGNIWIAAVDAAPDTD